MNAQNQSIMIENAHLMEIFTQAIKEVEDIGIKIGNIQMPIVINDKNENFWGRCIVVTNKISNQKCFTIEISSDLLKANDLVIKETIIHELLHTCKNCQTHGEEWTKLANKMNKAYGYNIKDRTLAMDKGLSQEDLDSYKYCVQCLKCKNKNYFANLTNEVKFAEVFRCSCGGKLKRVK